MAAEALFIEKGFFDVQMKALAVAVGISRNSLYRYFQDKNDLGYAVLGVVLNRIESRFQLLLTDPVLNAGLCGREQLRIILKTGFLNEDLRADFSFMAEFDAHFSGSRIPPDFQSRVGTSVSTSMWSRVGEIVADGNGRRIDSSGFQSKCVRDLGTVFDEGPTGAYSTAPLCPRRTVQRRSQSTSAEPDHRPDRRLEANRATVTRYRT